jgi:predicted XRE-type DNA-binding protein
MSKRIRMVRGSGNVFRDLGFPEDESRSLALRSELMIRVEGYVERSGLTRARASARLGLTQLRLNVLLRGKIEMFGLDALVNAAVRAGLRVNAPTEQLGQKQRRGPTA